MKLYISIVALLLVGCKSTPKPDYQMYVNDVENKFKVQTRKHKEFGTKESNEEPLQAVYEHCLLESYAGQAVNVGGINVTSEKALNNMFNDLITYTISQKMGVFMPSKKLQFVNNDYYMFKNYDFRTQVTDLEPSYIKVSQCLTGKGWDYYQAPKKG